MSSLTIPPSTKLSSLPYEKVSSVLGLLFEPTDSLNKLIYTTIIQSSSTSNSNSNSNSLDSYPTLIEKVRTLLLTSIDPSDDSQKDLVSEIIAAHPRLGSKKVDSEQSKKEQASLQSGSQQDQQQQLQQKLNELNQVYEKTFPGLRFVVFVNGRPLPEILQIMEKRIERNDYNLEVKEAFNVSYLFLFYLYYIYTNFLIYLYAGNV